MVIILVLIVWYSAGNSKKVQILVCFFVFFNFHFVVSQDERRWCVCIAKSQRILCLILLDGFWFAHIPLLSYSWQVFHTGVSWWSFTDVWLTAMLLSRWSQFFLRSPTVSIPFSILWVSTEKDIETRLTKAWTAINRLSTTWKSDLTDKMKRSFFQAAVTSILLYGCTTWTLTKRLEKKLDGNYTRMLRAILNKSWQQHPTRHQLYGHLPPITKTIQVRRTRHAGHCWRSRDEFIRDVLLWIPTHGRAKAGRPARTYIQQLCEDTGCCPEDLPRAMNDREEWRERVRDIRAASTIWWWWWWWW